jgi:hypothetical protein
MSSVLIETTVDLEWAYGSRSILPGGTGFVTEAIVPFEHRRGMSLVFALEHSKPCARRRRGTQFEVIAKFQDESGMWRITLREIPPS